MHFLNKRIKVEMKLFGGPKNFDKQNFEIKLTDVLGELFNEYKRKSQVQVITEARQKMLDMIAENLCGITENYIHVSFEFDDKFTEWAIHLGVNRLTYNPMVFHLESKGFEYAALVEKETLLKKFGFKRKMPKSTKYKVTLLGCEAILNGDQLESLREDVKKHLPTHTPLIKELKDDEQGEE